MFHVILKTLSTPAARTVLGTAVFATTCYMLRKSGAAGKVVESVAKVGDTATGAAVVLTSAAIDAGCLVADTAITAATVTADAAVKGVETVGYGVGRSARAVLDVTSTAGAVASSNPLSRGVVAGFYAPENAQAQPAVTSAAVQQICAQGGLAQA